MKKIVVKTRRGTKIVRVKETDLQPKKASTLNVCGSPSFPGNWPQASASMGCLPEEIPQFVDESRKIGIPIEFTKDGQAIFTDREHKRKYCQAHRVIDRSGFNW